MLWQIILAFLVIYIVWKLLRTEENDLAKLLGPQNLPILGNFYSFIGMSETEIFEKILELPKKYGSRFVIKVFNRYVLHVTSPDDIEVILTHSKNITKNTPYKFIMPWLGSGLLVNTGGKWQRRRKIITQTFHFDILKSFMPIFEEYSKNLVQHLTENVKEGNNVINVTPLISDFTLYIICETAMGIKLDSDKSEAKLKYKNAILEIGAIVIKRLTTVWLHSDFIFNMHPMAKKFNECLNIVHTFGESVIKERKKTYESSENDESFGKRRLALLDLLLESEKMGEIDLEGIRDEVNTFMFAGHDTTALTMSFGLMLLADHEEVQDRIYNECVEIFGDSDRYPTASDFGKMMYLDAVMKEMLRLYPSVPFLGREIVEDFMLGDLKVKKGVEVVVQIYGLHHRDDLFPEPEAFKPERFLDGETRHPYAYVPFSAGPRNCIGQKFARMEMKSMLSEIIRNFRLHPIEKGRRPAIKADLVLRTDDPLNVKFVPRH